LDREEPEYLAQALDDIEDEDVIILDEPFIESAQNEEGSEDEM
jgi:hypothetical protein